MPEERVPGPPSRELVRLHVAQRQALQAAGLELGKQTNAFVDFAGNHLLAAV